MSQSWCLSFKSQTKNINRGHMEGPRRIHRLCYLPCFRYRIEVRLVFGGRSTHQEVLYRRRISKSGASGRSGCGMLCM
ncbi:hypothetical protein COOONC_18848 [Cooperia oncophora]